MPTATATARAALIKSDPKLARLIEQTTIDPTAWRRERPLGDAFSVLVASIIGQQISGYAARAIGRRLVDRFGGHMPSPEELLSIEPQSLREVGLSRMKIEYLRSLAQHIIDGSLQTEKLQNLDDEAVRNQVTSVKGIGRWTADVFLLINLERPDVLPSGDLGIRSAIQRLYQLDHLPSPAEVETIGERWRPNRSLASFYLWASGRQPVATPKRKPAAARTK